MYHFSSVMKKPNSFFYVKSFTLWWIPNQNAVHYLNKLVISPVDVGLTYRAITSLLLEQKQFQSYFKSNGFFFFFFAIKGNMHNSWPQVSAVQLPSQGYCFHRANANYLWTLHSAEKKGSFSSFWRPCVWWAHSGNSLHFHVLAMNRESSECVACRFMIWQRAAALPVCFGSVGQCAPLVFPQSAQDYSFN